MEGAQEKAVKAVRLETDEAYFALDQASLRQLRSGLTKALVPNPLASPPTASAPTELPPVLAIGAPRTVRLDEHDDAPMLLATRMTGMRSWSISEEANERALVTDLGTGTTTWAPLSVSHKRAEPPTPSAKGPSPDPINAASVAVSVTRHLLLHRALGGAWAPGRYALAVVDYDWISNTVVVELEGKPADGGGASHARAPSAFLHAEAAPLALAAPGAALVVPSEVAAGAPIPVHGAVRLPRARAALATTSPEDAPHLPSVLVATVLLFGLDAEDPLAIELAIPAKVGPEEVEAAFSFDLTAALPAHPEARTYQAYLVAGDAISGPHPLRVGSR
jgi:hypothetical protein